MFLKNYRYVGATRIKQEQRFLALTFSRFSQLVKLVCPSEVKFGAAKRSRVKFHTIGQCVVIAVRKPMKNVKLRKRDPCTQALL